MTKKNNRSLKANSSLNSEHSTTSEYKFPPDWGKVKYTRGEGKNQSFIEFATCPFTSEWDMLKKDGSEHYKTGDIEPIDLYRSGGMFNHFARCSIIKYAYRLKDANDCDKIIHYAELLKAELKEIERSDRS